MVRSSHLCICRNTYPLIHNMCVYRTSVSECPVHHYWCAHTYQTALCFFVPRLTRLYIYGYYILKSTPFPQEGKFPRDIFWYGVVGWVNIGGPPKTVAKRERWWRSLFRKILVPFATYFLSLWLYFVLHFGENGPGDVRWGAEMAGRRKEVSRTTIPTVYRTDTVACKAKQRPCTHQHKHLAYNRLYGRHTQSQSQRWSTSPNSFPSATFAATIDVCIYRQCCAVWCNIYSNKQI